MLPAYVLGRMKSFFKKLSIVASFIVLGGCGFEALEQNSKVKVSTPAEFPRPNVVSESGFKIARGATNLEELETVFDPETKEMKLVGKVEYIPMQGESVRRIDVDLSGVIDEHGFINLKGTKQKSESGERVAAKATCLSAKGTCQDSFIDLYIYADGVVYHHQIESHQETKEQNSGADQDPEEFNKNTAENDVGPSDDELFENEGGSDIVEGEPGEFVGTVKDDIEALLEIKPDAKLLEEEEQEKSKQEEPQNDSTKPDDSKKNEAETEGSEKNTPKSDSKKNEEPKKEGSKNDTIKNEPEKEGADKVKPKSDGKKSDEPKKEGSKGDNSPKKNESEKEESERNKPKGEHSPNESWLETLKIPQSIGAANRGTLENAVDVLKYEEKYRPTGFHIIRPVRKTYFATNHLMHLIAQMGQVTKQNFKGYQLSIGDISYKKGGQLGRHASHQTGLDADIAYYFNNKSFQGYFASALEINRIHPNWMYDEQWKLFKFMVNTQLVDRIFVHRALKRKLCERAIQKGELQKGVKEGLAYETLRRVFSDEVHHNHFHLRVKFTFQPGAKRMLKCKTVNKKTSCRPVGDPVQQSGCF